MMDLPWLIGLVIIIAFFAVFEVRAVRNPDKQHTLSRFIYNTVHDRPVTIYLLGMLTGILIVHLFAHWCPT